MTDTEKCGIEIEEGDGEGLLMAKYMWIWKLVVESISLQ
jgi:hypothetical protein